MRAAAGGFTLIEALVMLAIFSVVAVAVGVGLQSVSRSSEVVESRLWASAQIVSTLENLHDTPYASLVSGSKTSDPDRFNTTYTISWTVQEIDPANPPTPKTGSGLKQVTVTLGNQSMVTWIAQ